MRLMFININEENANMPSIEALARQEFGQANLILVQNNGLSFEDCDGTRGMYRYCISGPHWKQSTDYRSL